MVSPWKPPFVDDVPTKMSINNDFPIFYPPFFQGIVPFKTTISMGYPLGKTCIFVGHNLWPWTLSLHGGLVLKSDTHWETSPGVATMTSTKQIPRGIPTSFFNVKQKTNMLLSMDYLWIIFIFPHPECVFFSEFPSTLSVLFVNTGVFLSFCRVIWQAWPSTKMDVSVPALIPDGYLFFIGVLGPLHRSVFTRVGLVISTIFFHKRLICCSYLSINRDILTLLLLCTLVLVRTQSHKPFTFHSSCPCPTLWFPERRREKISIRIKDPWWFVSLLTHHPYLRFITRSYTHVLLNIL